MAMCEIIQLFSVWLDQRTILELEDKRSLVPSSYLHVGSEEDYENRKLG